MNHFSILTSLNGELSSDSCKDEPYELVLDLVPRHARGRPFWMPRRPNSTVVGIELAVVLPDPLGDFPWFIPVSCASLWF
jgi:hypothetical protein